MAEEQPAKPESKPEQKPDAKPEPAKSGPPSDAKRTSPHEYTASPTGRAHRRRVLLFASLGILVAAGLVAIWYFMFVAPYESTDDAFIEGRVILISPRVSGQVIRLAVEDNQRVKQGEVLFEIDPADYETRVAQARADLAADRAQVEQARAQTEVDEAKASQQNAAVLAAEAESGRAEADLKRYESVESRAISQSQLDLARAQAHTTAANLDVSRNQAKAANAQVALSRVNVAAAEAKVKQAEAKLKEAELDLSYTRVTAPVDGRVTHRTVEQGIYLQAGQSVLALVPNDLWVVANFKETQLTLIRTNQRVRVRIDAYPHRWFNAHVDSIQSGTGARFSLLPPENAVGNYVKVVQRIPVKIVFDEPLDPQLNISPGMSVVPKVHVK